MARKIYQMDLSFQYDNRLKCWTFCIDGTIIHLCSKYNRAFIKKLIHSYEMVRQLEYLSFIDDMKKRELKDE